VATFIEIRTDAYGKNIKELKKKGRNFHGVRRPYRGYEIKEDTYALIKVVRADGKELPLVDAGAVPSGLEGAAKPATTYNYSNFIMQRLDESRQEKSQILETFGDSYVFFFGERPRIINVSGLLMNTLDFNWRTEFWYNYENTLRGTKLVEQNARMYLQWDDIIVEGYMLQAQARDDSDMPYHIPFSFTMFVTAHIYLSQIGTDDYPITHAVNLEPLLHSQDVMNAARELKAQGIAAERSISTTAAVLQAAKQSEYARQAAIAENAETILGGPLGQKFNMVKNVLANALILGMNAQNLTFLSIANHFFKNRKMRFPKGIAGSQSYAGPPTVVGDNTRYGFLPKRILPLRSKIHDNIDEYVESGAVGWNGVSQMDYAAEARAEEYQTLTDGYALETQALFELARVGVNPIQHPGGGPLEKAFNIAMGTTIVASAIVRWGMGALPKGP
jgi:hypothetical protein